MRRLVFQRVCRSTAVVAGPARIAPAAQISRRRAAVFAVALPAMLCVAVGLVSAQELPAPRGFVNDFAGVVSTEDERVMTRIIEAIQRETGAEIAVAVVESYAPYGSIEQYSIALAEAWGVGGAERDTGVVLLVAVEERELRIEVGYGLEGAITDGTAGQIRDDYLVPYLSENEWGEGLKAGVAAIAAEIADEYNVDLETLQIAAPERPAAARRSQGRDIGDIVYFIIVFFFVISGRFIWPLFFLGRRRRGFFGGGFGSMGGSHSSRGFSGFGGGGFGGGGASGDF